MAQKRMFDIRVTGTDKFADLPHSSKALYFMAGMSADDKGFFQPRKLKSMYGFSDDDYKILIAKGYFITFESGIMVITDWNKNNWLDSRRLQETEYIDELKMLKLINNKYELKDSKNIDENDSAKHLLSEYSIEENRIDNIIYNHNINIYNIIENLFGRTLNPVECEIISKWDDDDLTRYAIEKTLANNVRNIRYIDKILFNFKKDGIKTKEDAEKQQENYNNKSNKNSNDLVPIWFKKDIKKEEVSQDEENELNELMKNYK